MKFNPANALTTLRLLLVPFFVFAFLKGESQAALILFAIAGFTDLIDGTVARLCKTSTKYGAILDPIADKLLMQSCFVLLLIEGLLPLWFFALALARDVMIMSGIAYLELKKIEPPYKAIYASKFATLCMLVMSVLALVRMLNSAWISPDSQIAGWQMAFVWLSAALVIISAFQYVQIGLSFLNSRSKSRQTAR